MDTAVPACCDVRLPSVSLHVPGAGVPALAELAEWLAARPPGDVRVHVEGFVAPYGYAALEALRMRFGARGGRLALHDVPGAGYDRPFSAVIGYGGAAGGGPTTIGLRSFGAGDVTAIGPFLERQWADRADVLAGASVAYVVDSVGEVFVNGLTHARSDVGVVACGQYFSKPKQLHLSVVDLGIGIPRSLAESRGRREDEIDPARAIAWAFEEGHTTGGTSRGLGLAIFRDFLSASGARLHVFSGRGVATLEAGRWAVREAERAFPGTLLDLSLPAANVRSPGPRTRMI